MGSSSVKKRTKKPWKTTGIRVVGSRPVYCFTQILLGFVAGILWCSHTKDIKAIVGSNTEAFRVNGAGQKNASTAVTVFERNPTLFVDTFDDCANDENCHIFYHHVQKTGGSHIAAILFPLLENTEYVDTGIPATPGIGDDIVWCCNEKTMRAFQKNIPGYCSRKLGIYEVLGKDFSQVVQTCMNYYKNEQIAGVTPMQQRAVVLTSFREAVLRTVSAIHQQCNTGWKEKTKEYQEICDRCSYKDDPEFYDWFVNQTVRMYEGIQTAMAEISHNVDHVQLLAIDNPNINTFFTNLWTKRNQTEITLGKHNTENIKRCNFLVPSTVLKKLNYADRMYKDFVQGIFRMDSIIDKE